MWHSSRLNWIDNLKGFLLLIVIIEHVGNIPFYLKEMVLLTGGLAMPGYFALSGYLFSTKKNIKKFFQTKTKSLLVPYVIISIILVILDHNIYLTNGIIYFVDNIHRIFIEGLSANKGTPMWFVLTLYFICLISYLWLRSTNNSLIISLLAILSGISAWIIHKYNISMPLNFESLLAAYPYFLIGYILKQKGILEKISKFKPLYLCCISFVLLGILIIINHFFDIGGVKGATIPSLFIFYLYGLIGIAFIFMFFNNFANKELYFTIFVALNGMTFLGFHAYIQLYMFNVLRFLGSGLDANFYITLIVSIIICYVLCFLMNKYCFKMIGKEESKTFNETFYNQ